MDSVKEGSALYMTVAFTDENDDPIVPNDVRWRVDEISDPDNPVEVVGWTVASPASSISVTIDGTDNEILAANASAEFEKRMVIVEMDTGLSTQARQRKPYRIMNLRAAP